MSEPTSDRATEPTGLASYEANEPAAVIRRPTPEATGRHLILDARPSARTSAGTPALGGFVAAGLGAAAIAASIRSPLLLRVPLATAGVLLSYQGITGANPIERLFDPRSLLEPRQPSPGSDRLRAVSAVTVTRPQGTVLAFWRDPAQVRRALPGADRLNLELAEDREAADGQAIVWALSPTDGAHPTDGVELRLSLFVRAAPSVEGTESSEVRASLGPPSPEGPFGRIVHALLGEIPAAAIDEALCRSRALLEAGDIATTEGQPSGRLKPSPEAASPRYADLPAGARA